MRRIDVAELHQKNSNSTSDEQGAGLRLREDSYKGGRQNGVAARDVRSEGLCRHRTYFGPLPFVAQKKGHSSSKYTVPADSFGSWPLALALMGPIGGRVEWLMK